MWTLHHFPLCPFSRKVRIALAEKDVEFALELDYPWDRSDRLMDLNPAGQTPALVGERGAPLADSDAICEYFEETVEKAPLLGSGAAARAEVRRLTAWFDQKCYAEAVNPLMGERMYKRLVLRQPPDGRVLREAMKRAHGHLDYIDWLVDNRSWLAGSTMSLADLAAAAQVSVADYLGGIDWRGHDQARGWYAVFKSRPSFRPLLAEKMEGIHPPSHYAMVDG